MLEAVAVLDMQHLMVLAVAVMEVVLGLLLVVWGILAVGVAAEQVLAHHYHNLAVLVVLA
jgi:hypothetical protein